ncbi:MAG TPA: response regulator, partial [Burkholderiales bacterium]|nr:response regulator [Burkholderiales bacterium]
ELRDYVDRAFRQVAQDKGLEFKISMARNLPPAIRTDAKRLRQILKNLLSNAFKFTTKGAVSLEVSMVTSGWTPGHRLLDEASNVVAFAVIDTGIGIPLDKQQIIFEAFQQADGTTSRQFGGTGLGLSISSELSRLLGGDIRVESSPGEGSRFTLYIPVVLAPDGDGTLAKPARTEHTRPALVENEATRKHQAAEHSARSPAVPHDDLGNILPGDRVAVVVGDDTKVAASFLDRLHEQGIKGLIALNAHTALALAKKFTPDAMTLDIKLPDMDGWDVLNLLRQDPETRRIPVSVISIDDLNGQCMWLGALGFVQKPSRQETLSEALSRLRDVMQRDPGTLLVAAGNKTHRESIAKAIAKDHLQVTTANSGKEALELLLKGAGIDCLVIGPGLPDMAPVDLVRQLVQTERADQVSIIIYTAEDPGGAGRGGIDEVAEPLVLKRVPFPEAVVKETVMFIGHSIKDLPPRQRPSLSSLGAGMPDLSGRKVLVIDDDIRNIFALTSALEQQGMIVINAENGVDGIETLKKNPDIDIILMDLMMPELDGYDTIRVMRGLEHFRGVPIIGVTAKAMKGDREKCIEAGASDYVTKPVNMEHLLSVIRVWLVK